MEKQQLPWSFYSILISFAIFFGFLNIYAFTSLLNHPWVSDLWLIGVIIGLMLLMYSIYIMRVQQKQMIAQKQE